MRVAHPYRAAAAAVAKVRTTQIYCIQVHTNVYFINIFYTDCIPTTLSPLNISFLDLLCTIPLIEYSGKT